MAIKWLIIIIFQIQLSQQLCLPANKLKENVSETRQSCSSKANVNIVLMIDLVKRDQQNQFETAKKNINQFIDEIDIEKERLTFSTFVVRSSSVQSILTQGLLNDRKDIKRTIDFLDLDESEDDANNSMLSIGLMLTSNYLNTWPTVHRNNSINVVVIISTSQFKDTVSGETLKMANKLRLSSHVIFVEIGNSIGHKTHEFINSCKNYLVNFVGLRKVFRKILASTCNNN